MRYFFKKTLSVHPFYTGMKDGENIRFAGEGDQEPGLEAGDIIIILDEKPHEVFKRRDIDLVMSLELDLVQALCGLQRTITTLDKRTLVISTIPGMYRDCTQCHDTVSEEFKILILLSIHRMLHLYIYIHRAFSPFLEKTDCDSLLYGN